jgi:hypothetical protein
MYINVLIGFIMALCGLDYMGILLSFVCLGQDLERLLVYYYIIYRLVIKVVNIYSGVNSIRI